MKLTQDFLLKNLKAPIVAIIVFIISASTLVFFQDDADGKTFFMMIGFAASYYSFHNLKMQSWIQISKGILIGLASTMFLFLIIETIKAAFSNAQWDFMCFYMQGQLGLHHLDFYNSNSYNILLGKVNFHFAFHGGFKAEIFDVGFLSPPITMLFFAPLASLDYHTSRIILTVLTFIFMIGSTTLANTIFFKKGRTIYSLLFIFNIMMLIPGTNATISYNQTTFLILFLILLVIHKIEKPVAGFYLALSIIIKPVTCILILYFIFNKKWKPVIYFFVTGIILTAITGMIWGFQNVWGFFENPPTRRLPQYLYEQAGNGSLITVLNRNLKFLNIHFISQNIINGIYYLFAIILIAIACIASKKFNKINNSYLSFLVFLPCMLFIYPSSLIVYMVLIIPVLIHFLSLENEKKYLWIFIVPALSFMRTDQFFTYLILWVGILYIGIFQLNAGKNEDKPNMLAT